MQKTIVSKPFDMKDKTIKRIRWCCYVALALCALWGILYFSNIIRSLLGYDEWPIRRINWSEHRAYKIGLLVVYSLSIAAMIGICVKVAINILKGLRENTVFPKNNVKLLFWFVAVDFLYLLETISFYFLGYQSPLNYTYQVIVQWLMVLN